MSMTERAHAVRGPSRAAAHRRPESVKPSPETAPEHVDPVVQVDPSADIDEEEARYSRRVGSRLRDIRKQKRLSLQEVESISDQEFKASVLGAYERGERAISVPRLHRLAWFYRVPVDQLLPGTSDDDDAPVGEQVGDKRGAARIDLTRLEELDGSEAAMLARYLHMIQVQRQDFNGQVLTIRRDDMRAIACMLGVAEQTAAQRLDELGLRRR